MVNLFFCLNQCQIFHHGSCLSPFPEHFHAVIIPVSHFAREITTDHKERLTTTTDHDMTLHHFDSRGRVRVQLLTYVVMSGWKVSIVLLSANAVRCLKRCVCTNLFTHESMIMCSFKHNFPLVYPM